MVSEKLIESIVATYDLPSRIEDKVIRFVIGGVNSLHLEGFDNIYNYIGRVIDGFGTPYEARFVSLDRPISSRSENPFHHLFGADDQNLINLLKEPSEKLSINEAIDILGEIVSESDFKLLQQLANQRNHYGDTLLNISPERILANVETVQRRLEELAHKYEKNGELVLPRRTIWYIEFNPLLIRYKRRLTQRDVRELVGLYEPCNGNASEVARRMGCIDRTVRRHWGAHGLQAEGVRGDSLTEIQINQIIDVYGPSKGNALRASETVGHSVAAVLKYWRRKGFEIMAGGGHIILPQSKIDEINAVYETYNGDGSRASKALNISYSILIRNWQKVGLTPKGNKNPRRDQEKIEKIVSLYKRCDGNACEAARQWGVDNRTITAYWKDAGLKPRGNTLKKKK